LFATDVPPSKVVRIIDRFLMFYIRTADRLMRTARWMEQSEGGIEVGCRWTLWLILISIGAEIKKDNP
jgi:hypothetical protein